MLQLLRLLTTTKRMSNNFKLLCTTALLFLGIKSAFAQTGTYYTIRDLEAWSSAQVKYKVNKKLDFAFEEQLRLKDNATNVDQYFSELTVNYNLSKKINLGVGTRYVKVNDNVGKKQGYETHYRWNADVGYNHEINKLDLKYRLSYQSRNDRYISAADGDNIRNTLRFKISSGYNIKNWKFDPKLSAEFFNVLNNNEGLNRVRYTLGTDYNFKNAGELGAYFRMEKELTGVFRKTINIMGIQYIYTIKAKKI